MTNQAAQTIPELPDSQYRGGNDVFGKEFPLYTADQMHQYARDYAAALTREAPTDGADDALPIVAMLVDVAKAAHYAMDDCGDLLLTEEGSARLSNALDALDELPELDDGYVRDGWCKAKDHLAIALDAKVREQLAKRYEQEGFHGIAANLRGTQEAAAALSQTAGVVDGFVLIDKGAVKLVENVLRRNGKDEVADEMLSAIRNAMLAAAPAASGAHPDALPDGTLSKSTAKRVEALASASVSERARAFLAASYRESGDKAQALDVERRIPYVHHAIALRAIEQALLGGSG